MTNTMLKGKPDAGNPHVAPTPRRGSLLYTFVVLALSAQADVCTNTFKYTAANTPDTAYEWSEVTNWKTQDLGVPDGRNSKAVLQSASEPYFVSGGYGAGSPELSWPVFNRRSYYLGDLSVLGYDNTVDRAQFSMHAALVNGHLDDGSYIFGNVYGDDNSKNQTYYGAMQIAGHFYPGRSVSGENTTCYYAHTGMFVMRMDLFADDTNPVRTGSYHYKSDSVIDNGGLTFVGPRGADAHVSSWNLEEGSPYLSYAGDGLHGVVPGVTVTGNGIPSGTFVKRVFARTGWIELSNPVSSGGTGSAVSLSFGAITPSVSQYYGYHWQHSGHRILRVVKYRPQDGCTLYIGKVGMTDPGTAEKSYTVWGLTTDMLDAGYLAGDIVISNLVSASKLQFRSNQLETVNIRFVNDTADTLMSTLPASDFYWCMPTATAVSRIAVDAGKTANIYNLKNVQGTLCKDGDGTLLCRVADTVLAGSLTVSAGTLEIANTSETSGQTVTVSNLTLSAGARLKLPADGLAVVNLTAEAGATVVGPGTLTVTGTITGLPSVSGGASLAIAIPGMTRAACVAPYAPWFNMDASAADTLTTTTRNGTNFITKIMDASGSGEYVKPYGDGNDNQPWIVPGATNGMPFIDFGPFTSTNGCDGKTSEPDRALRLFGTNDVAYYGGYEILGKNIDKDTPRKPTIYTAFFAIDSARGGGSILGAHGNNYAMFGLVHGRNFTRNSETVVPFYCFDSTYNDTTFRSWANKTHVDNGSTALRVNGVGIYPNEDGFSGNFDIITLRTTEGRASSEFGHFYQGSKDYESSANGFAFGEYLLFTNRLSDAAIADIEMYMQSKWYGRRTTGKFAEGQSVRLETDSSISVTGSDGTLYLSGLVIAGGTVTGNVKLSDGAVLTVEVSDAGAISGVTVNGTVTLPASGSVALSGTVSALRPGDYPLCTATAFSGDVTALVAPTRRRSTCKLSIVGNVLTLHVPARGFVVILR